MDGKRLKKLRREKGLTQQQLADILNVDLSSIGKWEIHDFTPNKTTLFQLANFFEVTTDYLLGRTDSPNLAIPKEMEGIGVAFSSGISMEGLNADQIEDVMNYIDYIKSKKKN